jgi:hypothetical protein
MSSKVIASRLKQGQCIHCGIQMHEIKTKRMGLATKKIPLDIPGHVQHGRCLQASCLQAGSTVPNDDVHKPSGSRINAQTVGAAAQVASIGLGMLVGAPELGEAVAGFAGAVADSSSSTAATEASSSSMSQQQQPDHMAMLQQQQQPDYMAMLQQQQQQQPDYMAMLQQQQQEQQQPDYMAMLQQQQQQQQQQPDYMAMLQQQQQQQPDYMAILQQQQQQQPDCMAILQQQQQQQQQPDYMAILQQQQQQQQQPDYMAMLEQQLAASTAASQQSMQQLNELVAASQAESDRAMAELQQAFGANTLSGGGGVPQQCCPQGHDAPLTFCPCEASCDDCGKEMPPGVQVYLCVPCDYFTCADICS